MKPNFEKSFDNSYSYFREIQILTYLNQRSAPVPLLLEGSSKEKIITMEFVGKISMIRGMFYHLKIN